MGGTELGVMLFAGLGATNRRLTLLHFKAWERKKILLAGISLDNGFFLGDLSVQ